MKKINHFLKYTGSKRLLAPEIIGYFPRDIENFIEPFCGSAAVTLTMIANNFKCKNYIISDKNKNIVELLKIARDNPLDLIEHYRNFHQEFNSVSDKHIFENRKIVYNKTRDLFNKSGSEKDFFCLIHTCTNGTIRFNQAGGFNSSCHFTRPGCNPDRMAKHILQNSERLSRVDIQNKSYDTYAGDEGYFFFDPPYLRSGSLYESGFDHAKLFEFIQSVGKFAMTFDEGFDLWGVKYIDLNQQKSSFSQLYNQETVYVKERLFLK